MEGISPTLMCLIEIKTQILNGNSIKASIDHYVGLKKDELSVLLQKMMVCIQTEGDTKKILQNIENPYRRALVEVLVYGMRGASVLTQLKELECEIKMRAEEELEIHLKSLPIILLIPLLLFMFPAFLMLLLGPILNQLIQEMSL